jgi:hypothetical protein
MHRRIIVSFNNVVNPSPSNVRVINQKSKLVRRTSRHSGNYDTKRILIGKKRKVTT